MEEPARVDAVGCVMSTSSSTQVGQVAFRKRVLQIIRNLNQIQPFWLVIKELFPTVSTNVTLGTLGMGLLFQTGAAPPRASSARQALLPLQAQRLALIVAPAFIQPLLVQQPAAYATQII